MMSRTPRTPHTWKASDVAVKNARSCSSLRSLRSASVLLAEDDAGFSVQSLSSLAEEESFEFDAENGTKVTVAVRVRPFTAREKEESKNDNIVSMNGPETSVVDIHDKRHQFYYDHSFWSFDPASKSFATQELVYKMLALPLLERTFEGYNTCLFAYGQTGSGKTYSMMGTAKEVGIIPRFFEDLFQRIESKRDDECTFHVEMSYYEIYNENVHDLLTPSKEKKALKVREHNLLGPYVEELSTVVVTNFDDIKTWMELGSKKRATAATRMNDRSSRSHSVITVQMTRTKSDNVSDIDHDVSIRSKINMIDLAGSERQSFAHTSGIRLKEGASINKSLLTLGIVITRLSERSAGKKKKMYIPYRDSVLTWLLKESLGGNSHTAMLATVSPARMSVEETLSTLRYAKQARSIINPARVNEDPKARVIQELRSEIERLRGQCDTASRQAEIDSLRQQLKEKEKEVQEVAKSWEERLRLAEQRKAEETKQLEKAGIALKMSDTELYLINLNEDPSLSEALLYRLRQGTTRVGRLDDDSKCDIQLAGSLVAADHCQITYLKGVVTLKAKHEAPSYVNGTLVAKPTILHHGDRVVLGGAHFFRVHHPEEAKTLAKSKCPLAGDLKDFEFAKAEWERVQNEKIEQKVDAEREKARGEIALLEREKSRLREELAAAKKQVEVQKVEMDVFGKRLKRLEHEKEILKEEMERATKATNSPVLTKPHSSPFGSAILRRFEDILSDIDQRKKTYNGMECPPSVVGAEGALFAITMKLQEANELSRSLNRRMEFVRDEREENGRRVYVIRVRENGRSVVWTMDEFWKKVDAMRKQWNDIKDEGVSRIDLFLDEDWRVDESFNGSMGSWLASPHVTRLISRNSPSPSTPCTPVSRQNRLDASMDTPSSSYKNRDLVAGLCASAMSDWCDSCRDVSPLPFPSRLLRLYADMSRLLPSLRQGDSYLCSYDLLQLTMTAQNVVLVTEMLEKSLSEQSPMVRESCRRLTDVSLAAANSVSEALKSVKHTRTDATSATVDQLADAIHQLPVHLGKVCAAARLPMLLEPDATALSIDWEEGHVKAVLSGCAKLVEETLSRVTKELDNHHVEACALADGGHQDETLLQLYSNAVEVVVSARHLLFRFSRTMASDELPSSRGEYQQFYDEKLKLVELLTDLDSSMKLFVSAVDSVHKEKENKDNRCNLLDRFDCMATTMTALVELVSRLRRDLSDTTRDLLQIDLRAFVERRKAWSQTVDEWGGGRSSLKRHRTPLSSPRSAVSPVCVKRRRTPTKQTSSIHL